MPGGTTGTEMRDISGPEITRTEITLASAESMEIASILWWNVTATPFHQFNYLMTVYLYEKMLSLIIHFTNICVLQVLSRTKTFCPSLVWILVELYWKLRLVSTRWDGSCALELLSPDCPRRVRIFGGLATPWMDFIPSWERKWWNLFSAILINFLVMWVSRMKFNYSIQITYHWLFNSFNFCNRISEMDRLHWRQISARPFLRPAEFWIHHNWKNSVPFGSGERRKCHGFEIGKFHGTEKGNLFFLFHGSVELFF